ncbi:MAG: hypothetical protein ACKOCN_07840, partial [Planctomycetaceae bacterium]
IMVFADDTRPLVQGSRLTAGELVRRGLPGTVLVDAAAAHLMRTGEVASVIVGASPGRAAVFRPRRP